jgi:8-oxo-dGTP pyrophosphatase MutT (NUDIX family)
VKVPKIKMSEGKIEPVIAAGGVVFRYPSADGEPEVLMIFRNGKWDLPKGKHEPPESYAMCAVREVAEEVGSSIPAISGYVGETYHEYEMNGTKIGKTTYWYSMIFTHKEVRFSPQEAEGIEKAEWMPLEKAIKEAAYENLKTILKTFSNKKR